jgi:hypothetical protein
VKEFISEHPVILPIIGCTVGALAGEAPCGAAIAAAFALSSEKNIVAYDNGELTAAQFREAELEVTLTTALNALPGELLDRIDVLKEAVEDSPELELLLNIEKESPDVADLEAELAKLEAQLKCEGKLS